MTRDRNFCWVWQHCQRLRGFGKRLGCGKVNRVANPISGWCVGWQRSCWFGLVLKGFGPYVPLTGNVKGVEICWLVAAGAVARYDCRLNPGPSPQLFLAEKLRRREPKMLIFFRRKIGCVGPLLHRLRLWRIGGEGQGMRRLKERRRRLLENFGESASTPKEKGYVCQPNGV